MAKTQPQFTFVEYPEPHIGRAKQILKAHPEIRQLFGNNPWTAVITAGIVGLQFAVAIALSGQPWWAVIAAAWLIGAFADHALFVVIHECAHNLVFKRASSNKWMGIFANLPGVFPSAIGFRNYHLLHHRFQGEFDWDADLAGPTEAKVVSNGTIRKALWLLGFAFIEGIVRPSRVKKVELFDRWGIANIAVTCGIALVVLYFFGWASFAYLGLSTIFSVGLHPVGGRWIQEHYVVKEGQETYSYYGPLNKLALNVGYHNEHHDFMVIPWNKLPKLKAMAPEYYDNLHYHMSWPGLLLRFIFDPKLSLFSRVVREDHVERRKRKMNTEDTQQIINTVKAETAEEAPSTAVKQPAAETPAPATV